MTASKLAFVFILLLAAGGSAEARICSQLFRPTPNVDRLLIRSLVPQKQRVPTETEILRAVEADVLESKGLSLHSKKVARFTLALFRVQKARQELATVEYHVRETEQDLAAFGVIPRADIRAKMRKNAPLISAFVMAGIATAAVRVFGSLEPVLMPPLLIPYIRMFNWRKAPQSVIEEMIEPHAPSEDMPKLREHISNTLKNRLPFVRGSAEVLYRTARAYYYAGLTVVMLSTAVPAAIHASTPEGFNENVEMILQNGDRDIIEKNIETEKEARRKREIYVRQGRTSSVELMDEIIADVQQHNAQIIREAEERQKKDSR